MSTDERRAIAASLLRAAEQARFVSGLLTALLALPAAPAAAELVFDQPRVGFGDVYQHQTVSHRFTFTNRGAEPVTLRRVAPRLAGATVDRVPQRVAPGARGELTVHLPMGELLGETAVRVGVYTADTAEAQVRLGLTGFVQSAYVPERPAVEFGLVDAAAGAAVEIELDSREVERLELLAVEGAPSHLEVRPIDDGGAVGEPRRLRVALAPGAPAGRQGGSVTLRTNVAAQPVVLLHWHAAVFGPVVPSPHTAVFDLVRRGDRAERRVELVSRDGSPFTVAGATDRGGWLERIETAPCAGHGDPSPCWELALTFAAAAADLEGPQAGVVEVTLAPRDPAGAAETVPVAYRAFVVAAGTRVATVEADGEATAGLLAAATTEAVPGAPPVAAATGGGTAAGETTPTGAAAAVPQASLRWVAAGEDGVYGYLVYRSEDRGGPFVRVDPGIVHRQGDGVGRQRYSWVDRRVVPGRTYHYYLDLVSLDGFKRRFSGVVSKTIAPPSDQPSAGSPDGR